MKILVVPAAYSFPPREGVDAQLTLLMRSLSERMTDVILLPVTRGGGSFDLAAFQEALPRVRALTSVKRKWRYPLDAVLVECSRLGLPNRLSRAVREAIEATEPDVVHLQGFPLLPLAGAFATPTVFSMIDAWSLRQDRLGEQANGLQRAFFRLYARFALLQEKRLLHRASRTHVVSASEGEYLRRVNTAADIRTIPVMCNLPTLDGSIQRNRKSVLCWGDIAIPYLRDGLALLLREAWPLVQATTPGATLTVITREDADPELLAMAPPGTRFISWVDDVDRELQHHGVVVLMDQSGSGLKNRSVSALANQNALVGTNYALEAIPLADGEHAIRANTTRETANALNSLLGNPAWQVEIGANGRSLVETRFSKNTVTDMWLELYEAVVAEATRDAS